MVMSFQGQQVRPKHEPQPITVRDFMNTKVITFRWEQTMEEVIQILLEKNVTGGPVVDKDNNLIGVISEGDSLRQAVKGKYLNMPSLSDLVSECMVTEVETVSPEMDILDAANKFLNMRLRRFPVVENGKLVGQITQRSILKAVHNLKNSTWQQS